MRANVSIPWALLMLLVISLPLTFLVAKIWPEPKPHKADVWNFRYRTNEVTVIKTNIVVLRGVHYIYADDGPDQIDMGAKGCTWFVFRNGVRMIDSKGKEHDL